MQRWMVRHRRLLRYVGLGFIAGLALSVIVQLCYPAGRVLPGVTVGSISVGNQTTADAAKKIDAGYAKAALEIKTDSKSFKGLMVEAGIDVDATATARAAASYSLKERLIPFSAVGIMLGRDVPSTMRYDDDRLKAYSQTIEQQSYTAAVNASVIVKDGSAELVPAIPEKSYPIAKNIQAIKRTAFLPRTTIKLQPTTQAAARTNQEVQAVLQAAQKAVDTPLTVQIGDEKTEVKKEDIGSWLDFPEDASTKKLDMVVKRDALAKYFETQHAKAFKQPGTSTVKLIDGREVSRTNGTPGQGVDVDKAVGLVSSAIKKGGRATVSIPLATIQPTVKYERTFSNTDAGFAALLASIASAKGGFGIAVMEMNGRSANANGNKRFIAASTYKLYVAYAWFKKVEAGQASWDDTISGQNAAVCFEKMIVNSDNPCAKAFAAKMTWQHVEDMAKSIGATNTDLTGSNLYTTADDLAIFMYKLQNGTLVSAADKDRLIGLMKRQIYRNGIPAGTGVEVANKVGFVDGYLNDPAIVYGPKGPYIMVIMSSGSSWAQIADAAKQIHNYINQ